MSPSSRDPHDLLQRITHVLLFVIGSTGTPTADDWYRAVDDQFDDFDEAGKQRIIESAISLMSGNLQTPKPSLRLVA